MRVARRYRRRVVAALDLLDGWPAPHPAAGVLAADGSRLATRGDARRRHRWASITKLCTGLAVLVGVEEGTLDLDDEAGPPGSTVRHLLAHTSGLAFDDDRVLCEPGRRRTYSNTGYRLLAAALEARAAMPFERCLAEALLDPLDLRDTGLEGGMRTVSRGLDERAEVLSFLAAHLGWPTRDVEPLAGS